MAETAPASKDRGGSKSEGGGEKDRRSPQAEKTPQTREIGGPKGPEPTRYGDWEKGGRCTDF